MAVVVGIAAGGNLMMNGNKALFAAIDLGSNSFHMLVVRRVAGSVQVVAKIKRKVRLAAGLDSDNQLSEAAMRRGWECLALFAERLQDIPHSNVRVVATATLRLATNADLFVAKAATLLGREVEIISGDDEARLIYLGVAHTSSGRGRRLVIDIGGASTELVVGEQFEPRQLVSLGMGCVLYTNKFFGDGLLSAAAFNAAIAAACVVLKPVAASFCEHGWDRVLGASGTIQAVQEVLLASAVDERITLARLETLMQRCIDAGRLELLAISGLSPERSPVFAAGLAVLIAIFRTLGVSDMLLAGGALREGLVYEMLGGRPLEIRERTLVGLKSQFRIDQSHAARVSELALNLCQQIRQAWQLRELEGEEMLACAAQLYEVGLLIGFRQAHRHSQYIIEHATLPGFTVAQRHLLALLVGNYQERIDREAVGQISGFPPAQALRLVRLLRLAVILSGRRSGTAIPRMELHCYGETLQLTLPVGWLSGHPLIRAELEQEIHYSRDCGGELEIRDGLLPLA